MYSQINCVIVSPPQGRGVKRRLSTAVAIYDDQAASYPQWTSFPRRKQQLGPEPTWAYGLLSCFDRFIQRSESAAWHTTRLKANGAVSAVRCCAGGTTSDWTRRQGEGARRGVSRYCQNRNSRSPVTPGASASHTRSAVSSQLPAVSLQAS